MPRIYRRFGFTLIETLIVISLLGLLSGLGITVGKTQLDKGYDSSRKTDLKKLTTAFEEFYNDNECYPTNTQWQSATCGSVPDFLAPYMKSFPCDPVTRLPYTYQTTDNTGEYCDGTCGTCSGYRILASLSNKSDNDIYEVGCDPVEGCGIPTEDNRPLNWGIAMGNTVPVPGFLPGQGQNIGHDEDHDCKHFKDPGCTTPTPTTAVLTMTPTQTPSPTLTPTPTPWVACSEVLPAVYPAGKPCPGQLLPNASFETDSDGDRLPDGWDKPVGSYVVRTGEGIVCGPGASDGSCIYAMLPWVSPWSPTKVPWLRKTLIVSGESGTSFTLSGDARAKNLNEYAYNLGLSFTFYYTDNSVKNYNINYRGMNGCEWTYGVQSMIAEKAFSKVLVSVDYGPTSYDLAIDNLCLTKNLNPTPTPTPAKDECPGQLALNGSFETESEIGSQYPLYWNLINDYVVKLYDGEGRICSDATKGSCSYRMFPLYYPSAGTNHQANLVQSMLVPGEPGDTVTVALDARRHIPFIPNADSYNSNVVLALYPSDGLPGSDSIRYPLNNWLDDTWERKTISVKATRPFYGIRLELGQFINGQQISFDNVCVKKSP